MRDICPHSDNARRWNVVGLNKGTRARPSLWERHCSIREYDRLQTPLSQNNTTVDIIQLTRELEQRRDASDGLSIDSHGVRFTPLCAGDAGGRARRHVK